jgi:hypothetical protein
MPILNLTPHPIALFAASQIPASPTFYRTGAGHLRVADSIPDPHEPPGDRIMIPLGYSQWDPQPVPARVSEERSDVSLLPVPEIESMDGSGSLEGVTALVHRQVPIRSVRHGVPTGLPDLVEGTYLIVSLPVVAAARAIGRATSDLLTPGDLVRDQNGEIAGVTSFYRW